MARAYTERDLATIYLDGADLRHPTECVVRHAIEQALACAQRAGTAWRWDRATHALGDAYRAAGLIPPSATGYDWHCGTHPLSVAIRALRSERRATAEAR